MVRSSLNILIVEDHQDTLVVFGWFLEGLGYRCKLAATADLALGMAQAERCDVLITDVWLAEWDGFELVAELRRRGCLPRCVLSMSAGDDRFAAARSKKVGCHKHLVKPMLSEELGTLLQEAGYVAADGGRVERTSMQPSVHRGSEQQV